MKSKIFGLLSLSIFALVIVAGLGSAALSLTSSPSELSQNSGTFTINIVGGATTPTAVATATATLNIGNNIESITITDGGSSYISSPTITITDGTNTDTSAIATIVDGKITEITGYNNYITYTPTPTITINDPTLTNVDLTIVSPKDSDNEEISFTYDSIINLDNEGQGSAEIDYTTTDFDFDFGETYAVEITVVDQDDASNNKTLSLNFEKTGFYEGSNPGDLDVSDIDFDVKEGFGDDDEWYPFDVIETTFNVDNPGKYDVKDIKIEACLYDEDAKECVLDEGDMDISDDKFDLDDGDDKDVTLTFKVEAKKLNAGNEDYTLYIKAVGELTGSKAKDDDVNGDDTGDYDSKSVSITTEDNFALLDDIEINGMPITDDFELVDSVACGAELNIVGDVWNIDSDNQDDVTLLISNSELGINKKIEIGDINDFDSESFNTVITLPKDVEAKYYYLEFRIYDEDNDLFENSKDDDKAEFHILLNVAGCTTQAKAIVSASLESGGVAGEELVVRGTIVNSGDSEATYNLNLAGFGSWATSGNLDSNTITLDKGEQKDVLITFNVKEDISGEQNFNIEVLSDSDMVLSQPVAVTIEEAQKSFLSSITGNAIGGGNTYLWIIGFLNVILVVIIIIVAIRVARK